MHRVRGIVTLSILCLALSLPVTMTFGFVAEVDALTGHAPICIEGNDEFTPGNGVIAGTGTAEDPYIIEGWTINASEEHGIRIQDTTAHFVIRNVTAFDGEYLDDGFGAKDGVSLYNVTNGRIENVTVERCRYGVSVFYSQDVLVTAVSASFNNFSGICLHQSRNAHAEGNFVSENLFNGIIVGYCSDSRVVDNTVVDTSHDGFSSTGIDVWQCYDVNISRNRLRGNGNSIMLDISHNLTASFNTIENDTGHAIYLYHTENNTVMGNSVSNASQCMAIQGSSNNTVYRNNFYSCGVALYDPGPNDFDGGYPFGGNYWSVYEGVDQYNGADQDILGPDGIGDDEYDIGGDLVDRYPLMEPVSWKPSAGFVVDPAIGGLDTVFRVDASLCWDVEDLQESLEVRWDWEDDGVWDTEWTQAKVAEHQFASEGLFTIRLEVRDTDSSTSDAVGQVVVDATPPATDFDISGIEGENGWYTSALEVALSAHDEWSEVAGTSYSLDGNAWTDYTGAVSIVGEGVHTLEFFSVDSAGNIEVEENVSLSIDTIEPEVGEIAVSGEVDFLAQDQSWYSSEVTVSIPASDDTSGVDAVMYRLDESAWQNYSSAVTISSSGNHSIDYYAVDVAGNTGDIATYNVKVDIGPPVLMVTSVGEGDVLPTGDFLLTWTCSESHSGVYRFFVNVDGAPYGTYNASVRETLISGLSEGEHEIQILAMDNAGNMGVSIVHFRVADENGFSQLAWLAIGLAAVFAVVVVVGVTWALRSK